MEAKKKEKVQKPKYNMWQCICYMITLAWKEKEKKVLVLCVLLAVLTVLNNLVNLYISPKILSILESRSSLKELFLAIFIFVFALLFCSAAIEYIKTNTMFGRGSVRNALVEALNQKAAITSYPNIEEDNFSKLLAKASEAVAGKTLSTELIWNTLTELIKNIIGFLIYVYLLSYVNPWLIAVIMATTVIGYFVSKYANGYQYRHRDEAADLIKKMYYIRRCAKDYSAAKDIRIFGIKPWYEEIYAKTLKVYTAFFHKAQTAETWARVTDLILAVLRNGIAYVYLIALVLSGELTASEFLLYFSAISGFTAWVTGILGELSTLYKQCLDISTVRECLEYPEQFLFEEGKALEAEKQQKYEIRLENVSFRYPDAEKDILSHVNLTLSPGEQLAVVGLNGAGKTTLIKLICGFLDPTEGRVLLNGRDIREYNRRDYYKMFSAVFQTFSLLAGSIAANVAQTEEEIDFVKVKACVEKAGLKDKIEALPKQYDTLLDRDIYPDAVMLSGGETQRLMLARALYKDAPFVILDEPTAALDPVAEADMYQRYHQLTGDKSSIYISHRLASTRFCDRVILLEKAGIAEEGTHEELLKKGGRYAELFAVQSKYYQEGECTYEG